MKVITSVLCQLLLGINCTSVVIAGSSKSWPRLYSVKVNAEVECDNDVCKYLYCVYNSTRNTYGLSAFDVDLRTSGAAHVFSRNDLTLTHTLAEHIKTIDSAELYPILNISSPDGWAGRGGSWYIPDLGDTGRIRTGQTLCGFSFSARESAVGIKDCIVESHNWDFANNPEDYEYPGRKLGRTGDPDELTTEVNKGITYVSKSIAPVKPSDSFTVSSWTARMNSDAVEARKLKWIKTDRVLRDIQRLVADLNVQDIEKLKSSVNKMESYVISERKKGNLTDEADALVRLNAQYLLRRLEKQEPVK